MINRVEPTHPRPPIERRAKQRQQQIDDRDPCADLGRARQRLFHPFGEFHPEELHPADLQHRQNRYRHDNDPDPAQPLQQRPPQQDSGRRVIQSDDDRGTGGRDPAHRFEKGVRIGQVQIRKGQRQRRESRQQAPGRRCHNKSLTNGQRIRLGPIGQCQHRPNEQGQCRRGRENLPIRVSDRQIDRSRQNHSGRQRDQQNAVHQQDWTEIEQIPLRDG